MFRWLGEFFLVYLLKFALWFRYRIKVTGVKQLNHELLNRPGGILFLPNHTAMGIDPISIVTKLWPKYRVKPMIVEYMYYTPIIHPLMKFIKAIPIPNNEVSSNSLKKKRSDVALHDIVKGLKRGDNYLMYPSGRLKDTGYEFIGGASGTWRILNEFPEVNVVLVRAVGLWGSSFSKSYKGYSPNLFETFLFGLKKTLKNLIFFNPRRTIQIEFQVAPKEFPRYGTRLEINQWLEKWYDRPEGLRPPGCTVIGEPLKQVSYSIWSKDTLEPLPPPERAEQDPEINLEKISDITKRKIISKLSQIADVPQDRITPNTLISRDLSLDSLDMAELVLFLDDEFDVKGVPVIELSTVGRMMAIAERQIGVSEQEEQVKDIRPWYQKIERKAIDVAPGATIPEVFLNNCERMGKALCMGDDRSGILTYQRAKLGICVLAEYIRKLEGDYIGIMLPASVGASLAILAAQLAGKIPVMINWTLGPRHLSHVAEATQLKTILSSWAFIDRLGNVDLDCINNELVMLEDVRREFGLGVKLKGLRLSKKSPKALLKYFGTDQKTKEDTAVVLFTSGTEKAPKGVPLSYNNILSNLRSICKSVEVYSDDTYFAILPPFHSFGITAGVFFGTLTGMKVAFYPNPTNGLGLAKGVEKWRATVLTAAPTFLKGMIKAGEARQFKTLRWLVSGAEKAPPELYRSLEKMGMGGFLKEGYGCTETSPVITVNRMEVEPKGVGQPLEGVEVKIIHPETYESLSTGQEGLIIAHGPNVFNGYLTKTAGDPFIQLSGKRYYNTGDLGYVDELNRLTISGRLKRFIKVGGEMISLSAIENALLEAAPQKGWRLAEDLPSIAVSGRELPDGKPQIAVFTTFAVKMDDLNKTLREAGFSNLVKVTDAHHVEEIPVMGTGKIFYRQLESEYMA